jgi:hypothetical protein
MLLKKKAQLYDSLLCYMAAVINPKREMTNSDYLYIKNIPTLCFCIHILINYYFYYFDANKLLSFQSYAFLLAAWYRRLWTTQLLTGCPKSELDIKIIPSPNPLFFQKISDSACNEP